MVCIFGISTWRENLQPGMENLQKSSENHQSKIIGRKSLVENHWSKIIGKLPKTSLYVLRILYNKNPLRLLVKYFRHEKKKLYISTRSCNILYLFPAYLVILLLSLCVCMSVFYSGISEKLTASSLDDTVPSILPGNSTTTTCRNMT